ncbi:CRAL/TRIO domain-containing protein [Phlegmacium glaucopus]|nr:CRAL/TRIO domain-containing protein [Phlegmacium glaucopus]
MTEFSAEKSFLPIPPPTIYKDDPRAELQESEQPMYDKVVEHFSQTDYSIPNIEKGELTDQEKFWLSRECILRYLRASKWKLATAITRIENTLTWRREYGLYDILNANHVEPEAVTGKQITFGFDVKGKPAFYMIPSRQNTDDPVRQIQFVVWMLERAIELMGPGVETMALLINFADKGKHPAMSTSRTILSFLQDHYPERLGLAIFINLPFIVTTTLKIIMPFVDPITREKVKFNPNIFGEGLFLPDMVMKQGWDGNQDFEYVHEKYWAGLVELCESRAKDWMENWRSLGGKVGIAEWEYKQGNVPIAKGEAGEVTDEKEEILVTTEAKVAEVPKKEVESVPHITVDAAEPKEAIHHVENEGQSVAMASAAGAITGGVEDSGFAFDAGHGGDGGGD